ncbi:MAG: glycosyltransferase family 2 protein [Eubacterium sp.]|nr:glycosyltransferase family 2 protein [Eubacterium sp.]
MSQQFDIPVALILFRRIDTLDSIIARLRQVNPQKVYLLSDQGRTEEEREQVKKVREYVLALIDWDCEVVKYFAGENRGVYKNIALGAKWVFEREESAIFLEDDNLPETTFFDYCKEMLEKYKTDSRVLWVCGTNYLGSYVPEDDASYVFTRQLLPCGWASWSDKFLKYYDFNLDTLNAVNAKRVRQSFIDKRLFTQLMDWVLMEKSRYEKQGNYFSWDYHMAWSVRVHSMFGISPAKNQIKNIGVDSLSEHGGSSLDMEMTKRFCGMDSSPLTFPLKHPQTVLQDHEYEKRVEKIILLPFESRFRGNVSKSIHKLLKIPREENWKKYIKEHFFRGNK